MHLKFFKTQQAKRLSLMHFGEIDIKLVKVIKKVRKTHVFKSVNIVKSLYKNAFVKIIFLNKRCR